MGDALREDPVASAIAVMTLYWPHVGKLTEAQVEACYRQWEDIPPNALLAALDKLARTEKWCPGPGIIAAAALDALAGPRRSAGEVLAEVMGQIGAVGRYDRPELSEDARLAVESLGGWGNVCQMSAEFLPTSLRKAYEGRVADERERRLAPVSWRELTGGSMRELTEGER